MNKIKHNIHYIRYEYDNQSIRDVKLNEINRKEKYTNINTNLWKIRKTNDKK